MNQEMSQKVVPQLKGVFGNALYHKNLTKGFGVDMFLGAPWTWFSLEIASIDGRVHFYIRTPVTFKELIETQIYTPIPTSESCRG